MTMMMAIGAGILMTAVAVAIAGLVIEMVLVAMSRSLTPRTEPDVEQANRGAVIHLRPLEDSTSTLEWVEEAAA